MGVERGNERRFGSVYNIDVNTSCCIREMYFSIEMDLCSTCKVDLGSIAQIELDHSSILTRKFRLVRTRYLFFAPCLHPRK